MSTLEQRLAAARSRDVAWDDRRHTRVRARVEHVHHARKRRTRAASVVLSSLAGAALFALAIRAFGFTEPTAPSPAGAEAQLPSPAATYADGGFRVDATLRD